MCVAAIYYRSRARENTCDAFYYVMRGLRALYLEIYCQLQVYTLVVVSGVAINTLNIICTSLDGDACNVGRNAECFIVQFISNAFGIRDFRERLINEWMLEG